MPSKQASGNITGDFRALSGAIVIGATSFLVLRHLLRDERIEASSRVIINFLRGERARKNDDAPEESAESSFDSD
jgi:hypothetical protein